MENRNIGQALHVLQFAAFSYFAFLFSEDKELIISFENGVTFLIFNINNLLLQCFFFL